MNPFLLQDHRTSVLNHQNLDLIATWAMEQHPAYKSNCPDQLMYVIRCYPSNFNQQDVRVAMVILS